MSKRRTINELRQVKAFGYRAPHSHDNRLDENRRVSFTKEELRDFSVELLQEVMDMSSISIEEDLIYEYVKEYFD